MTLEVFFILVCFIPVITWMVYLLAVTVERLQETARVQKESIEKLSQLWWYLGQDDEDDDEDDDENDDQPSGPRKAYMRN